MNQELFYKATSYCCSAEHCISEVQSKLRQWGAEEGESDEIISQLVDERYIDEQRYAVAYTRDKVRFAHWGKKKIVFMLSGKKIKQSDITYALEQIEAEEYQQMLSKILTTKKRSLKNLSNEVLRNKLFAFALSRGFSYDEINQALNL